MSSQYRTRQERARQGKARQDKARQGKARQGKTRQGKARQDKARQGKARQGKAWQDKTRQDKISALTVSVQLQAVGQFNVGGDDGLAVGTVVVGFLYLGARTPVRPIDYPVEEGILAQSDFIEWLQSDT